MKSRALIATSAAVFVTQIFLAQSYVCAQPGTSSTSREAAVTENKRVTQIAEEALKNLKQQTYQDDGIKLDLPSNWPAGKDLDSSEIFRFETDPGVSIRMTVSDTPTASLEEFSQKLGAKFNARPELHTKLVSEQQGVSNGVEVRRLVVETDSEKDGKAVKRRQLLYLMLKNGKRYALGGAVDGPIAPMEPLFDKILDSLRFLEN